jgi:hypothetical protein
MSYTRTSWSGGVGAIASLGAADNRGKNHTVKVTTLQDNRGKSQDHRTPNQKKNSDRKQTNVSTTDGRSRADLEVLQRKAAAKDAAKKMSDQIRQTANVPSSDDAVAPIPGAVAPVVVTAGGGLWTVPKPSPDVQYTPPTIDELVVDTAPPPPPKSSGLGKIGLIAAIGAGAYYFFLHR